MNPLNLAQLKSSIKPLPHRDVPLDELGGRCVRITTLFALERLEWEKSAFPEGVVDTKEYWIGLVARTLIDPETGKPMMSTDDLGRSFSKGALEVLSDAAQELNGVGAKVVTETAGKSDEIPASSGDSNSLGDSDTRTPIS